MSPELLHRDDVIPVGDRLGHASGESGVYGGGVVHLLRQDQIHRPGLVGVAHGQPDDIVRWNAASDDWHTTSCKVDLRVGGSFCSRMEAKDGSMGFDFEGSYTRLSPRCASSTA